MSKNQDAARLDAVQLAAQASELVAKLASALHAANALPDRLHKGDMLSSEMKILAIHLGIDFKALLAAEKAKPKK